jgi:phage shock protein A
MRQQRDSLSQQLLDTQSQLQLVAQENEKLKKEVADLTTKVAELTPKKP